ncbi:putative choline dehydrogenase [Penicillium brasilianum]|uniref:Putative choline dehydrogenase n=1 Tax=Penicillium brasilianum TaxID=104259 RepID=A0A1S9RDY3_PENBI|nr:putative choline dehydrogenase [Penicillium brasilianum]
MFQDFETFCQLPLHYIIVGGGTAGLAVAARLSEDPEVNVGVIEAGPSALDGNDGGAITVPGRYGETIGSKYDWQFETTPQPGLGGRSLKWPRGRVLGGTSALNFMAWNRGHRDDYDAWARLGNQGWGWDDLLPYFRRSETFHQPGAAHQEYYHSSYDDEFNGTTGPLHTTHIKQYGPAHQYWHAALKELGVASNQDSLAGSNCGVWNMVCTIDPHRQERSYSASAYYAPVAARKNLHVLTDATALNVLIEMTNGEWCASGVRVRYGDEEKNLKTIREVILSAGSVQSPQLLELSGIGQRKVLEAAGIDVKIDNSNVGENLQDHMMTATIFEVLPTLSSRDDILNDTILREAADRAYYASQTGPWTVLPCSVAYCPLAQLASPNEQAQLHITAQNIAQETGRSQDELLGEQFDSTKKMRGQLEYIFDLGNWSTYFESKPGKKYGTLLQMLQYPFSRGSIHISPQKDLSRKSTAGDKPVIDPRYYQGPGEIDRQVMVLGQRMAERISQTEPLAKIIQKRVFPPLSENSTLEQSVHEEFVSNYTVTDWHPVGTCAMGGREGAKTGVVDERLRVYGVRGLRVIDASVMPLQVGAHIQATVYAIAEKGAAMIREDWSGSV